MQQAKHTNFQIICIVTYARKKHGIIIQQSVPMGSTTQYVVS